MILLENVDYVQITYNVLKSFIGYTLKFSTAYPMNTISTVFTSTLYRQFCISVCYIDKASLQNHVNDKWPHISYSAIGLADIVWLHCI